MARHLSGWQPRSDPTGVFPTVYRYKTMQAKVRIPVVSKDGKPLMPTTPAKARKLIKGGVAIGRHNKLGMFYIQMLREVGTKTQPLKMAVDYGSKMAVDYGSKYDGYAVTGGKEVCLKAMAKMPERVAKKVLERGRMRRARRYRLWRRKKRFDNRRRRVGWIAPSQQSKVELRQKIVRELAKVYPIDEVGVEDIAFDHYNKKYGKYFSTAEIGKTAFYRTLEEIASIVKFKGWQTSALRKEYDIPKSSKKDVLLPESHANDAVALLCGMFDHLVAYTGACFWYWQRPEFSRRALHRQHHQKGHLRPLFGGTTNGSSFRKGDYVEAQKADKGYVGWVCGLPTERTPLVGVLDSQGKRIGQFTIKKTELIRKSTGVLGRNSSPSKS